MSDDELQLLIKSRERLVADEDDNAQTPLHCAAHAGHARIVHLLIGALSMKSRFLLCAPVA